MTTRGAGLFWVYTFRIHSGTRQLVEANDERTAEIDGQIPPADFS
jgi:hypothetical protein